MKFKYLRICCFFYVLQFSTSLHAQSIENSINLYGINYPQEKIHIHFDKESYLPGETIWFKAYLFEEDLPSARSTNFYAALYDEDGKLLQQLVSPIFKSTADGHFDLPDTIQSTQLICRAYTTWMLNFDTSFIFSKTIKILGSAVPENITPAVQTVSLQFFPEGGDILEGTVNSIAFKTNYNNGLPFNTEGVIKKQETGEIMMPLAEKHDGMGKFDLMIAPGERYYAEWVDNTGNKQQTYLPAAKAKGVCLKLAMQKDKMYFNLVNKTGFDSLHVLMYMYQKVFYKANIVVTDTEFYTGLLPITELPSGTMQVTVFDANWQPVAERVAFINNNNFTVNAGVVSKMINLQKRGKNELEILVADSIPANMSLSITDADMNSERIENTIVSDFLLKGDVKGYINNPAYYFSSNTDSVVKQNLDLVMLTNGWRRYNWADMMVEKKQAVYFPADDYLSIYGQVGNEASTKLEKDEPVNLIIKTADSTISFYSVLPDKNGFLKTNGLVFYDSSRVYFSFNKNKLLNKQMAFSNSNFLHVQPGMIGNYRDYLLPIAAKASENQNTSLFKYYADNNGIKLFNKEKTLKTVVVKAGAGRNWKNDPMVKMDEKYASGLFAGGANSFAIDVLHDETAETSINIFNYIGYKIPGLTVVSTHDMSAPKKFMHRFGEPAIYIDGSYSDNSYLQSLPVSQIAYIKFFESSVSEGIKTGGADASGFTPVLAIYMKKGDDLIDRRPKDTDLGFVKIPGYSPYKEFYSPDYSLDNTGTGTDARTTLLWKPYIFTDANERKVPITFYNNDFTKKFKIVLEGINEEGKMVHFEKIIE